MNTQDRAREALARAFGQPVHVEPTEFIAKMIAGTYGHQPSMSGDPRDRLTQAQRRAVDEVAASLAAALTPAEADVETVERVAEAICEHQHSRNNLDGSKPWWGERKSQPPGSFLVSGVDKDMFRDFARAALAALPPRPADDVAKLREALWKCRAQFEFYVAQHLAKSPPDMDKAAINQEFVEMIDAALSDGEQGK